MESKLCPAFVWCAPSPIASSSQALQSSTTCTFSQYHLQHTTHSRRLRPTHARARPISMTSETASASSTTVVDKLAPLARSLEPLSGDQRFVLVGGKGGVGKTTTSSAMAVHSARLGKRTLIVSTDPAHSLGDALDVELKNRGVVRVGEEFGLQLWALEIDSEKAAAEFRTLIAGLKNMDVPGDLAQKLGLSEFGDLFDSLPPGADELVALTKVMELAFGTGSEERFERIIIDTAPTGHTLRMLAFPDFLDSFLQKAVSIRNKLERVRGIMNMVMAQQGVKVDLDAAVAKIEIFRKKLTALADLLRDPAKSEFVVVSIATKLAVEESERLVSKLTDEGVWVRNIVVNQLLADDASKEAFAARVVKDQKKSIEKISGLCDKNQVRMLKISQFDEEIQNVFGLRAFGKIALKDFIDIDPNSNAVTTESEAGTLKENPKSNFVFVGGKGGVGKTTTSSSLAVKYADAGLKTLVISTDPAHSLGDALSMDLSSGKPELVDGTENNMYAMEIDTQVAIQDFKQAVTLFSKQGGAGIGANLAKELGAEDFASVLDNTPPGIDELLALVKVMGFVRSGEFDRVVIDTAPTGHTLRLLAFPDFLDTLLGKILTLKSKLDGLLKGLTGMFNRSSDQPDTIEIAAAKIRQFQEDAAFLRGLIRNPKQTQFVVVTIPTILATLESERLIQSLVSQGILVQNVVMNQILPENMSVDYVERRRKSQKKYLERLERFKQGMSEMEITRVPFFDLEIRGVFGLEAMAYSLFHPKDLN